jgi:uncharacterized membrane protein YkvA (DUF1232 family)
MLDAFADRLKAEVEKPSTDLQRYLSRYVPSDDLKHAAREVQYFVLHLPEHIKLLGELLSAKETPLVIKMFYASVLAYLLNPHDFLPEDVYGLYGYLDDAYLTVAAMQRTVGHIPRPLRARFAEDIARVDLSSERLTSVRHYLPPPVLEKLNAALDSFELAAFIICEQSSVGEVESVMGSRFASLTRDDAP